MNIGEFLFGTRKHSLCVQERVFDKWNRLQDYFGDVPENIQERFVEDWRKDYILENLQTHDWNTLSLKLQDLIGLEYYQLDNSWLSSDQSSDDRKNFYIEFKDISVEDLKSKLNSPGCQRLLNMYGYVVREVQRQILNRVLVFFEPIYTESADDFIYGQCNGVVYHVIFSRDENSTTLYKSIKNSGLRCRTGNGKYPARIYFWAQKPDSYGQIMKNIKTFCLNDLGADLDQWKDAIVVRIRLPRDSGSVNGIPVYKDTAMGKGAFYTYTNIPASCLDGIVKGHGVDPCEK